VLELPRHKLDALCIGSSTFGLLDRTYNSTHVPSSSFW
jgi:hypothetical protein